MLKIYATPALVAKGEIIDTTRFGSVGPGDPMNSRIGLGTTPGNVGFQL
jgi:hypothetical protein